MTFQTVIYLSNFDPIRIRIKRRAQLTSGSIKRVYCILSNLLNLRLVSIS